MRVVGIIVDLGVPDLDSAREFYADYLGLAVEDLGLDWVERYVSPETGAQLQVLTGDATAAEDPVVTVKVDDVDDALEDARRRGYEIVHPLTTESWGVTRFMVRAPGGAVVNVAQHRE